MTNSIAVVCEAKADFRIATDLADRVFCETIGWLTPDLVETVRRYRGVGGSEPFLRWKDVPTAARRLGIKVHGYFGDQPGELEAAATRRALHVCMASGRRPDGVILLRDSDNEPRERGIRQARDHFVEASGSRSVVVGVAHTKRECWVLAGFEPRTSDEKRRLRDLKSGRFALGFDPLTHAERLTAADESAKKSAKRVLNELTQRHPLREEACWKETPLGLLRRRGKRNGLTRFLSEIRNRLCPLLSRSH